MKQTAVEFLVEQLIPKAMVEYDTTTYNAINKAKEMEKEQIIIAEMETLRVIEKYGISSIEPLINELKQRLETFKSE